MIFSSKADDNGRRKTEANSLITNFLSRVELLHAMEQQSANESNATNLFGRPGMNRSTSGTITHFTKIKAPSTTSLSSFQTIEGPWSANAQNIHNEDADSSSIYENDSVSILSSRPLTWENDKDVPACRQCSRKFSFLIRRHHCRYAYSNNEDIKQHNDSCTFYSDL